MSYQHVYAQIRWEIHSLPRTVLESWHPEVTNATGSLWVAGLCQGHSLWIRAVCVEVEPATKFAAAMYFRRAVPEDWLPPCWVDAQPNALPQQVVTSTVIQRINLSLSNLYLNLQIERSFNLPARRRSNLQSDRRAQIAPVAKQGLVI